MTLRQNALLLKMVPVIHKWWCSRLIKNAGSLLVTQPVKGIGLCVMSEASRGSDAPPEHNKVGPDYFGFYTCEVAELLSQDEDFLPFSSQSSDLAGRTLGVVRDKDITKDGYNGKESNSFSASASGSLFCNGIGDGLSDFKRERLKALLQQSVVTLTQEVDEMLDPVLSVCRIQSYLKCKKDQKGLLSHSGASCEGDTREHPRKKLKLSSSSSSIDIPLHSSPVNFRATGEVSGQECMDVALPGKEISNDVEKTCAHCRSTENSKCRNGPEAPKVDDDLQFLLENDGSKVEQTMKKYSDELSTTLGHMEQKIEELLDTVMSNCRLMTLAEKQQLRKRIQKLPPRNLDRVVEIVQSSKPSRKYSCDEIHIDLEKEDDATLWRLYYYVEAVENARKLPM